MTNTDVARATGMSEADVATFLAAGFSHADLVGLYGKPKAAAQTPAAPEKPLTDAQRRKQARAKLSDAQKLALLNGLAPTAPESPKTGAEYAYRVDEKRGKLVIEIDLKQPLSRVWVSKKNQPNIKLAGGNSEYVTLHPEGVKDARQYYLPTIWLNAVK